MADQPAQDPMPIALADYTQDQVDELSHGEIADRLRRYSHPLLKAAADSIDYLGAQEGLLEKAQQAAERACAELAEHKRPLNDEMARLNRRVIELTSELDALRLKLPVANADLTAQVIHTPDGGVAGVSIGGRVREYADEKPSEGRALEARSQAQAAKLQALANSTGTPGVQPTHESKENKHG